MNEKRVNSPGDRLFDQIFQVWILPEIEKRQKNGNLATPATIQAVQIIFYDDSRPTEVRINEEVKGGAYYSLKEPIDADIGTVVEVPIANVDELTKFELSEDEDPDCAHLTALRTGNRWHIAFDLVYNKGKSSKYIAAAVEFIEAADYSLKREHYSAFIDNLFSAAELAAKAYLQTIGGYRLPENKSHKRVHSLYNIHAHLGNVESHKASVLNELMSLRGAARYLNNEFFMSQEKGFQLLDTVLLMIDQARQTVQFDSE